MARSRPKIVAGWPLIPPETWPHPKFPQRYPSIPPATWPQSTLVARYPLIPPETWPPMDSWHLTFPADGRVALLPDEPLRRQALHRLAAVVRDRARAVRMRLSVEQRVAEAAGLVGEEEASYSVGPLSHAGDEQ
jgi:hypothetical protein